MIAALALDQNNTDSTISQKFARGNFIAVIDKHKKAAELIPNPFVNETSHAGKKLYDLLTQKHKVDTFIAYELGYRTQQLATRNKIQLIILQNKHSKLIHILELIGIDLDRV